MEKTKKKKYDRIFVLNDNRSLRINTALAEEIGFNESIILLQIEFLISISNNFRDGKKWTYQSAQNLKDNYFPFWSRATIQRTLKNIISNKLLMVSNFNTRKSDRTKWYSLNCEELVKLKSVKIDGCEQRNVQNEQSNNQNNQSSIQSEQASSQNEPTLPENSSDITSEKNICKKVSRQLSSNGTINFEEEKISIFVYSISGEFICVDKSKSYVVEEMIKKRLITALKRINPNADSLLENEKQIEAAIFMCSIEEVGYPGILDAIRNLIELNDSERDGFMFEYPIPDGLTFIQIRNNYTKIKNYYKRMKNNEEYYKWYDNFYCKK